MSPYLAYFLGLLTVIVIILLFFFVARFSPPVRAIYLNTICQVTPQTTTNGSSTTTNGTTTNGTST